MKKNRSEFSSREKKADGKAQHRTVTGLLKHKAKLSRKDYRDLVECSGSIIMKTDRDLNITYINDFGLEFFGYSMGEILGRNVVGTTIPKRDDAGRDLEAMAEDIKNSPQSFGTNVHQNMRKNGMLVWVSWTNKPKYDENGNMTEILAIGNDISKLIEAETALRESRDEAELLIRYAPTGIYEMDYTGPRFLSVNDTMCQLTGYSREELLSMDPFMLLDEQGVKLFGERIRSILTGHDIPDNVEYKVRAKDGRELWATLNVKILSEKPGSRRAIVIAHDVTTRKKTQTALLESEKKLAEANRQTTDILESISDCFYSLDRDLRFIYVNKAAEEIWGLKRSGLIGRKIEDVFPGLINTSLSKFLQVLREGKPQYYELHSKDLDRWGEMRVHPTPDGIAVYFHDITERRKMENELKKINETLEEKVLLRTAEMEKLNEKLLRSNRELENFAYVASHDLQEPLRMITSFTQLLARKYNEKFDAEAREFMGYIVDGGKRMYELINGLLAFSRIGTQEITFSGVDLNTIIDIVKVNLAVKIKERSCKIHCDKLPEVYANHNQMIQLFQNLVANSIKFSKDQPHVYISCKAGKNEYILSVRDEGIGIEPQYFDKIFQIFKRLMPRDEYEGTGIGLSICKKIVENHQGKIWVESEPGKGSVFYFTLRSTP